MTMTYGVFATLIFPATPMKAWFLTEREKEIAVRRLATNNTGIQTRKFKWKHAREAFLDPQLYVFGIYSFSFAFVNNAIGRYDLTRCQSRRPSAYLKLTILPQLRGVSGNLVWLF